MPFVRFLETRTVKDGSGLTYEKGNIYELPQTSIDRWVRRRAVELVDEKTVKKKDISTPITVDDGMTVENVEEEKPKKGKSSPDAMKTSDVVDEDKEEGEEESKEE